MGKSILFSWRKKRPCCHPNYVLKNAMNTAYGQSRSSLNILVVEDSADTANSLAAILAYDGHNVQQAYDGDAARNVVTLCWPDVVLLDIAMPGCDGYHVAKRIREQSGQKQKPLFIVISGYATEADRQRSEAEGIYQHFAKPMEPDVLSGLLRDIAVNRSVWQVEGAAAT
jgi:CheY-like chemotaxis protein